MGKMVVYLEKLYNDFFVIPTGYVTRGIGKDGKEYLTINRDEVLLRKHSRLIKKIISNKIIY